MVIYALYCPKTDKPVYVGGTDKVSNTYYGLKANRWIDLLSKEALDPKYVILEEYRFVHEGFNQNEKLHFWIEKFNKEGHVLLNNEKVKPEYFINKEITEPIVDTDGLAEIGSFVRYKRERSNLSQEEFANKIGISVSTLREAEKGTGKLKLKTLQAILSMFGVELAYQFTKARD